MVFVSHCLVAFWMACNVYKETHTEAFLMLDFFFYLVLHFINFKCSLFLCHKIENRYIAIFKPRRKLNPHFQFLLSTSSKQQAVVLYSYNVHPNMSRFFIHLLEIKMSLCLHSFEISRRKCTKTHFTLMKKITVCFCSNNNKIEKLQRNYL